MVCHTLRVLRHNDVWRRELLPLELNVRIFARVCQISFLNVRGSVPREWLASQVHLFLGRAREKWIRNQTSSFVLRACWSDESDEAVDTLKVTDACFGLGMQIFPSLSHFFATAQQSCKTGMKQAWCELECADTCSNYQSFWPCHCVGAVPSPSMSPRIKFQYPCVGTVKIYTGW